MTAEPFLSVTPEGRFQDSSAYNLLGRPVGAWGGAPASLLMGRGAPGPAPQCSLGKRVLPERLAQPGGLQGA